MDAVELTPQEWEWFKQLARLSPLNRKLPTDIRWKLLKLKLVKEDVGGVLGPTAEGRDVLRLVDDRPRASWRKRESRLKIPGPRLR
jgi:hypothetical protein